MSSEEAAGAVAALADEVARAWFDADPLRASLLGVHDRAGELSQSAQDAGAAAAGAVIGPCRVWRRARE